MSPRVPAGFAHVGLVLTLLGCGDDGGHDRARSERAAVLGTVLDRATGEPIEGARVTLPGGREAETDALGRFAVRDLDPGLSGAVEVRHDDRTAAVELRPLRPGPLEIVLHAGR